VSKLSKFRPFAVACVLLVALPAFSQDVLFTPDEIRAKLVGKKLFSRNSNGALVDFAMLPDGTASVALNNFSDTGTWRLDEKGYCTKWQKIRNGAEACYTIVRRGSSTYILNPDGSYSGEILNSVN
jgi:hypothetical protein